MKKVTMNQLLKNPSGPNTAYFSRRDLIIDNLTDRFFKIIKKHPKIDYEIYDKDDSYYFFIKFPSEKYNKLKYDVVLEFSPASELSSNDFTLNNYNLRLFSNSPNFIFSYTYVYNQDKIIIDFLKDKINDKALNDPPEKKNPLQSYGFEKSVYFAMLFIKHFKLHVKSNIMSKSKPLKKKELLKSISSSDDKMKEYNRIKNNQVSKRKTQKTVAKKTKNSYNGDREIQKGRTSQNKKSLGKRDMKHNMKVNKKKG
ncbi:hypothetical protein Bp8pS_282 [Bacillus phage vB_BpuM-BpSp]|nr:hypothetical protein Bp8pS_282 [Bacillus phage vB_BpuM-BpSp]